MKFTIKDLLLVVIFAIITWAVAFGLIKYWDYEVKGNIGQYEKTTFDDFCRDRGGDYQIGTYKDRNNKDQTVLKCYLYE